MRFEKKNLSLSQIFDPHPNPESLEKNEKKNDKKISADIVWFNFLEHAVVPTPRAFTLNYVREPTESLKKEKKEKKINFLGMKLTNSRTKERTSRCEKYTKMKLAHYSKKNKEKTRI